MSSSFVKPSQTSSRKRPDPPAANEWAKSNAIVPPNSDDSVIESFHIDDDVDLHNQPWRQYGHRRRQYLLENDKATTSSYRMNAACSIQKYFALSERVIAQFEDLYKKNSIEDAYVMGNRLIAFLGTALPRHPAYTASVAQRNVTERHLLHIKATMKRISILIDEDQLNRYITNDFDPLIDDEDEDENDLLQNSTDNFETSAPATWEPFAGWSSHNENTPGFADTDESSQDIDSDIDFTNFDLTKRWGASSRGVDKSEGHQTDFTDSAVSDIYDDDEDDTDDSDDGRNDPLSMRMKPPVLAQSILRKIAREAVRYESDSEAADSWAQDGNCGASDATSSSEVGDAATTTSSTLHINNSPRAATSAPILSCDPARFAFRSIMNRHTRHLQSLQVEMESLLSPDPIPYHPQPKTLPASKFDLPHVQHQLSTDDEDKKVYQEEEKKDEGDQNEDPEKTMQPKRELDALTVSLSFSLPPPAISSPQLMDPMLISSSKRTVSDLPDEQVRTTREESPLRRNTQMTLGTPYNSPEEANLHRSAVPSSVVSNRWGVKLRSPSASLKSPSPIRRQQHLL